MGSAHLRVTFSDSVVCGSLTDTSGVASPSLKRCRACSAASSCYLVGARKRDEKFKDVWRIPEPDVSIFRQHSSTSSSLCALGVADAQSGQGDIVLLGRVASAEGRVAGESRPQRACHARDSDPSVFWVFEHYDLLAACLWTGQDLHHQRPRLETSLGRAEMDALLAARHISIAESRGQIVTKGFLDPGATHHVTGGKILFASFTGRRMGVPHRAHALKRLSSFGRGWSWNGRGQFARSGRRHDGAAVNNYVNHSSCDVEYICSQRRN